MVADQLVDFVYNAFTAYGREGILVAGLAAYAALVTYEMRARTAATVGGPFECMHLLRSCTCGRLVDSLSV